VINLAAAEKTGGNVTGRGLRGVGARGIEREGVPDRAGYPVQCTARKRQRHECLIGTGERCMDPEIPGNHETEFRVIRRVSDNDNDPVPEALAFLKSLFNKSSTDPEALEILVNGEGGEGEGRGLSRVRDDHYRRKKDMPDDPVTVYSNKREFAIVVTITTEGIHEPCLAILPECLEIDFKNGVDIFRAFLPDKK
jgi:hypothetical protein